MTTVSSIAPFKCAEPGCGQMVYVEKGSRVPVGMGHGKVVTTYKCSGCGRLHTINGYPVYQNNTEKLFCTEAGLVTRIIKSAADKLGAITSLIKQAEGKDEVGIGYIVLGLTEIVESGHATDCRSGKKNSPCSCGVLMANKFISKHPLAEA